MVVDPAWVEAKNHKNVTLPFSLSQVMLPSDLRQLPVRSLMTPAPAISYVRSTLLGYPPVISRVGNALSGQPKTRLDDDLSRIGRQLGIRWIASAPLHGCGSRLTVAHPFQSFAGCSLVQEPVDLPPDGGPDATDVLPQAGSIEGFVPGQTGELTKALRVTHVERQVGVGKMMPALEDCHAQHLLGGQTWYPLACTGGVTQIVCNQIQDRGLTIEGLGNSFQLLDEPEVGPAA